MATTKATIEVKGFRVDCDRCGVVLAEDTHDEVAQQLATDGGAWRLEGPPLTGDNRQRKSLWLCQRCAADVHEHVLATSRARKRAAS